MPLSSAFASFCTLFLMLYVPAFVGYVIVDPLCNCLGCAHLIYSGSFHGNKNNSGNFRGSFEL